MGLENGTVRLDNNYETYKKMFEVKKQELEKIFGKFALEIEHVGSTSVENLLAKPIVDIGIGVNNFEEINSIINNLKDYTIKKSEEEILLIEEKDGITYYLIHIEKIDSKRYKDSIKFRNILRNNEKIKKEYEKLKEELKEKYPNDRPTYTKSKSNFINNILNRE